MSNFSTIEVKGHNMTEKCSSEPYLNSEVPRNSILLIKKT